MIAPSKFLGYCTVAILWIVAAMPFAASASENGAAVDTPACCRALSEDPDAYSCSDRALALFYPLTIAPKSWLFSIEHRGASPAFDHPFRDGFGFDNGGLKIDIGFRFAPIRSLDMGIRRSGNGLDPFDTYEFDVRYRLTDERKHYADLAIDGGATVFYPTVGSVSSGCFGQLLAGRSIGGRLYCSAGASFHSKSTYLTKTALDKTWTLCVPAGLTFRFSKKFSMLGELFEPVAGYGAGSPGYAWGFKDVTWRHTFSLFLTNTQYSTIDGAVAGAKRVDKPVFGFLITRRIGAE
jgi:hypothetical protein